ncbi:SH3 domain containing ring finger 3 L homeolog [Xenopus laevis]|nr:SH3 domain containing ring finger 3 L homeolog [Xenopus laevis]AAI06540.1 MGC131299 protein [Xenopus laevis]
MDESSLLDLLECSVCLERLDTSARVLPCQHTFCRRCLHSIVSSRNELRCPECRVLVECGVEDLPANILLVRLLDGIRQRPRGSPTGSPTATGQHGSSNNSNNHSSNCGSPGCSAAHTANASCTTSLRDLAAASQNALMLAKGNVFIHDPVLDIINAEKALWEQTLRFGRGCYVHIYVDSNRLLDSRGNL